MEGAGIELSLNDACTSELGEVPRSAWPLKRKAMALDSFFISIVGLLQRRQQPASKSDYL